MSIKKRQKRSALLAYIILAVGAVFMIIPFLWMVLTSFKTYRETVKLPIQWFPAEWNFDNYVEVLKQLDFLRYYRNTILVTVTTLVAMTLIASLAAYAFARMEFPGKNVIFALLLVVYMVPPQMTMIPKYMMITKLGWVDTLAGIVVPNIFSVYTMFMLRQFFVSVPKELDEAAEIDGCTNFKFLYTIGVPLIKPSLGALIIYVFLQSWNYYLWPLLVTDSVNMRTVQIGLGMLQGAEATDFRPVMAGAMVILIPSILVFIIGQKQMISGLTAGAVKG